MNNFSASGSAKPGHRFMHLYVSRPTKETRASLESWKNSHDQFIRVMTPEEFETFKAGRE